MTIITYAVLAALATVIGGSLPLLHKKITPKQLTILVAFSAGILLSTGLNHMVIESFEIAGQWAVLALSCGFVLLYGYERMAMIHACRERGCEAHSFGKAALVGMSFHSFLDGFAIAISFEIEQTLGFLVVTAVMLHRLPTGFSLAAITLAHGYKESKTWIILITISLLAIVGAAAGLLLNFTNHHFLIAVALGLSSGTFIYISTSDLLPMAHKNNQDYLVPFAFLIGFFGILATRFFEI